MYLSQAVKDWSHLQKYLDFLNEMVLLHVRGPTKHKNTTLVRGLSIASEEMSAPNMINFVRKYNLDPSISRLLTWKWRQLEKVVQTLHQARPELHNATIRTKKLPIASEEMSAPNMIILETLNYSKSTIILADISDVEHLKFGGPENCSLWPKRNSFKSISR